jgi:rRNA-processing protein FCF1
MEIFIIIAVLAVLAETTYLTYRASRQNGTSRGDILLDTSVLIDGRILAIARSGLLSARLIVVRSVVRELQFMADKADHDKRERARYGLEVIEKLQELPGTQVEVREDGELSEHGVDEQLILLAQKTGAKLCTIDYNLNKAARVQSVEIININELAHALRVIHLPGEKIDVQLIQPGQDKKQAVGYLDDGTMVVVDDSRDQIGETVAVELTRVLQTTAGRMMFAKRIFVSQTRGAAKGGGRMIADNKKPSTEQTSAEGKARSSMFASPKSDKAAREVKGRRQIVAHSSTSQTLKPRTQKPRHNKRRQTPEDSMVDLANK